MASCYRRRHCTVDESLLTGESVAVAQDANGTRPCRPGDARRRRLAVRLRRHARRAGRCARPGHGDWRAHRDGQDRPRPRDDDHRGDAAPARDASAWCGSWRSSPVRSRSRSSLVYGVTRHDWLQGVLAGLTLAMAILPNEFPVVVTMFLALGAWRLSRAARAHAADPGGRGARLGHRPVRRQDGHADAEPDDREPAFGRWHHVRRAAPRAGAVCPKTFHTAVEYAVLASRRDPFDPMEVAFKRLAEEQLAGTEHLHPDWTLVREYPLTRERLAVVQVWRAATGELVVACKGAPEAVARLCSLDDGDPRSDRQRPRDGRRWPARARRRPRNDRSRPRCSRGSRRACRSRSSGWWASPIRCARRCAPRSQSATQPGSASS